MSLQMRCTHFCLAPFPVLDESSHPRKLSFPHFDFRDTTQLLLFWTGLDSAIILRELEDETRIAPAAYNANALNILHEP